MHQDATWYGGRPQHRRLCVRWGPSSPRKKGTAPPNFWPMSIYCGQTAGWIKIPLGTEGNLGPGDVVLDEVAAHPLNGAQPQVFGLCLLWPNGCMYEYATWYGSRARPRATLCYTGTHLPAKGAQQPPSFRPMSILATVAHLSYC